MVILFYEFYGQQSHLQLAILSLFLLYQRQSGMSIDLKAENVSGFCVIQNDN